MLCIIRDWRLEKEVLKESKSTKTFIDKCLKTKTSAKYGKPNMTKVVLVQNQLSSFSNRCVRLGNHHCTRISNHQSRMKSDIREQ